MGHHQGEQSSHHRLPPYGVKRKNEISAKLTLLVILSLGLLVVLFIYPSLVEIPFLVGILGVIPGFLLIQIVGLFVESFLIEKARAKESFLRHGAPVLGAPPERECFSKALERSRKSGKKILDKYLIGFEVETGEGLWVSDDEICNHAAVFAKTGVGKTLWLESLIFQQMLRGRASGCTFIDAKRDSSTLAHVIYMAQLAGRMEDLIIIDPLQPLHAYNFVLTPQKADVKARKVLRSALPATSDSSTTKHYDRLAADSVFRVVRALESLGLSWSVQDVAVSLGSFALAYPHLRSFLEEKGDTEGLLELGHLASSYRTSKGTLDAQKLTDNLRGISSELHSLSAGETGTLFCANHTDLSLTSAILQGKIIYFMLPRLEESEGASRMLKVFREDLEVSIGEITSSRTMSLEDPHLVVIDEGASTFGPSWANLFELARKGRFALIFGAQSSGGLMDQSQGLSTAFYERVMANISLKVIMRVGDNKTASELSEWMGKVPAVKTTTSKATSRGRAGTAVGVLLNSAAKRTSENISTVSTSQTEIPYVSPDELKHELSAEKGLAWVDLAGRKRVKMRALWMDLSLSEEWEGRYLVPPLEIYEKDSLSLHRLVNKDIFLGEQAAHIDSSRRQESLPSHSQLGPGEKILTQPSSSFKLSAEPSKGNRFGNITAIPTIEVSQSNAQPTSEPTSQDTPSRFTLRPKKK